MDSNKGLQPKDFVDPILQSLFDLSNRKSFISIDVKEVYSDVCRRMGIDIDAYGYAPGTEGANGDSGTPIIQRRIQYGFRTLIENKWGESPKKGQWALTEEGVKKMKDLLNEENSITLPAFEGVEDPNTDKGIMQAMSTQSKCIGYPSTQGVTCKGCSLVFRCQDKMYTELHRIAVQLSKDPEAFVKKPATGMSGQEYGLATFGGEPDSFCILEEKEVRDVAPCCAVCGEKLNAGEKVCYVLKKYAKTEKSGLFHIDCYEGRTRK
jgi:hypothetical protein